MSDIIRVLPESIANQIAAGEVVQAPASVVKELMENSVDAGATTVTVNFRDGGKELIQVVDDGCGMSPADARLAFERHATSKIRTATDIYALHSFGFRGEALASIASVAEVELRTRQKDNELGESVRINGGKFECQGPVQVQAGTQFMVRNLFFNIPARRRFLKDGAAEAKAIVAEFQKVALCYPEVAFNLYNNDTQIYNLPASSLRQRIVGVMGKPIATNLLEVSVDTSLIKVEGFIGRPLAAKKRAGEQFLFVNGRYFKSPYLQKAVFQAYEKLIASDMKPAMFLYMTVPPESIDVNVHPSKTEIKFDEEKAIWQIINAAVRETLGKTGVLPMMDFEMDDTIEIPVREANVTYKIPDVSLNPSFNPFAGGEESKGTGAGRSYDRRPAAGVMAAGDVTEFYSSSFDRMGAADDDIEIDSALADFIEGRSEGETASQGQLELDSGMLFSGYMPLGGRYVASGFGDGIVVVDTARARERVLYESYLTRSGWGGSVSQQLLFPEEVGLDQNDMTVLRESLQDLEAIGFDLEVIDDDSVRVTGVPPDMGQVPPEVILRDILDNISSGEDSGAEWRGRSIAAAMAARCARGCVSLNEEQWTELLGQLMECGEYNYTPSGLVVMTIISPEEIEKRFAR